MSAGEAPALPPEEEHGRDDGGDDGRDDGHGFGRGDVGASAFARRVGPIVAAVGLLGVVVTIGWIALSPDNVVGTVADAGITVPATAVAVSAEGVDADDCLLVVEGDGSDRQLCPDVDGILDIGGAWWAEDGRLVIPTRAGEYLVDPTTGAAEGPVTEGEVGPPDIGFREDVYADGSVVRRGRWGGDGPVVLDLGGPAGGLGAAVQSPDGQWVVAVDGKGRVLVAASAEPTEVHVWFEVDEDRWFDPWMSLRWDE